MKEYTIKYEDTSGECHIESYKVYHHRLITTMCKHTVKLIYWIKDKDGNKL